MYTGTDLHEALKWWDFDKLGKIHTQLMEETAGDECLVLVIINEQHELLDDQVRAIREIAENPTICNLKIPADGLSAEYQEELAEEFANSGCHIVFASPIPLLLLRLTAKFKNLVGVLHNDYREKKELPNQKIVYTVAQEGWKVYTI